MIDKKHIGMTLPQHSVAVEAGRLRFFSKAIGETDTVYTDEAAAKAAGYRALPAPPTFLFSLDLEREDPLDWLIRLGMDLGKILHGEQSFTYHAPVCAGDTVTFDTRISDIYDKKGGALEFVVKETRVRNQDTVHVADLKSTVVHRSA